MKVWIVHQDIECEFGQVIDVFDSQEKAEAYRDRCLAGEEEGYSNEDPENWSVDEWAVS